METQTSATRCGSAREQAWSTPFGSAMALTLRLAVWSSETWNQDRRSQATSLSSTGLCSSTWLLFASGDSQAIRHSDALHFAGRPLGNIFKNQDAPRHFESGQPVRGEYLQLTFGDLYSLPGNHRGVNAFAQHGTRHTKGQHRGHRRMVSKHLVYFCRRNFLSTTVDDFFQATG